jgi:hypothetical protein
MRSAYAAAMGGHGPRAARAAAGSNIGQCGHGGMLTLSSLVLGAARMRWRMPLPHFARKPGNGRCLVAEVAASHNRADLLVWALRSGGRGCA